jgi:hypothetical protein
MTTRRAFIQKAVIATAGLNLGALTYSCEKSGNNRNSEGVNKKALIRPDLLDDKSPEGIEVFQLTTFTYMPSSHLYMEAQIFTPDSKHLVLHCSAVAHGSSMSNPLHQYLRCDIDDGCTLHWLTSETGATAASVSPDGKYLYYFVNETKVGGGKLTLKRVNMDGTDRQTILVVDSPLPDTNFRPSGIYPLSTISSDGRSLALSAFLGDGQMQNPPFGLMVFDVEKATVRLILQGQTWCNLHPQYCRSSDIEAMHDILIQENHGNVTTPSGIVTQLTGGAGADIHVIRDDGSNFRDLPWGRDGNEYCQGHQCWRGNTTWAITSTGCSHPSEAQLIEGKTALPANHAGILTPGGIRNNISRNFPSPHFYHFATDFAGKRLVSDAGSLDIRANIYMAELGIAGQDPAGKFTYLLSPRSTSVKDSHIHPFLSPDGKMAFFNSDESGLLQAYMIKGLEHV